MSDYSAYAQANPGTDYPVKDTALRAQLSLDSDKVDSAGIGYQFGYKRNTTAALNVGYYGGVINVGGTKTTIADGTVALTNAATNYVERTTAGVVSKNTVGYTAGQIPMFRAVTAGGVVTEVTDDRQSNVFGDVVAAGVVFSADGAVGTPGIAFLSDPDSGLYRIGANHIGIAVNGANAIDIGTSGVATVGTFSANAVDITPESGTWTLSLGGNTTYLGQGGTYKKNGKQVFVRGQMYVNVIGTGSVDTISGLPFTSATAKIFGLPVATYSGINTNVVSLNGHIAGAATTIVMRGQTAAGVADGVVSTFKNSAYLELSGSYHTD